MRYFLNIFALITIYFLTGCSEPQETTEETTVSFDPTISYDAVEEVTKTSNASITKDGGWTIVSLVEKGDRVYWFVAPDIDKVSPALFKKTIHLIDKNSKETVSVSKCEAPKQTCDDLMEQFKTMSDKYK